MTLTKTTMLTVVAALSMGLAFIGTARAADHDHHRNHGNSHHSDWHGQGRRDHSDWKAEGRHDNGLHLGWSKNGHSHSTTRRWVDVRRSGTNRRWVDVHRSRTTHRIPWSHTRVIRSRKVTLHHAPTTTRWRGVSADRMRQRRVDAATHRVSTKHGSSRWHK